MTVDKEEIRELCLLNGQYHGPNLVIYALVAWQKKRSLLSRLFWPMRDPHTLRFGTDWKVVDEYGTVFAGQLDDCIDYLIRHN